MSIIRPGTTTPILTAASSPAPSPSGATTVHQLARANTVSAYITYNGTVNACAIRLWLYDGANWYEGPSTDDLDPLTPGGASPVNESRDWEIGEGQKFTFQLESISGGGTAAVSAEGAV